MFFAGTANNTTEPIVGKGTGMERQEKIGRKFEDRVELAFWKKSLPRIPNNTTFAAMYLG